MSRFHSLIVADITKETSDCVSIAFQIPAELTKDYKYTQGQYLTIKLNIGGEELRRSYSICSAPHEPELRIAIKKVEGGRVSSYVNDKVRKGDAIEAMIPMGNFYTPLNPANKKHYNLFAAGSGITPIISIIKSVLNTEPQSVVNLFYSNRDENSVIFKQKIYELAVKFSSNFKAYHIYSRIANADNDLLCGRITKAKASALIDNYIKLDNNNEFFICGPAGLITSVQETLQNLGVDKKRIHFEYFDTPVNDAPKKDLPVVKGAKATIIMDGEERTTELKPNETILEAALRIGLDAPYACQGGSCCTCRAKLTEGKVNMEVNYALTDADLEDGFILTCQSRPASSSVVVDYDKGM